MKRMGWGALIVLMIIITMTPSSSALTTTPSTSQPVKVSGPLLITGYSFSGHSLRYVQIYNSSSAVVNLTGWKLTAEYSGGISTSMSLNGLIAPGTYVTAGSTTWLPSATFTFVDTSVATDPMLSTVTLTPPSDTNYLPEQTVVSVSTSTPRVAGTPATFYFARSLSTSTGNYVSGYTAFIPSSTFSVMSDSLYTLPTDTNSLEITEIFSDSSSCAPGDGALKCADYVKLHNTSSTAVDMSRYRIRTGSASQTATTSTTAIVNSILPANGYINVSLQLSSSGSWVWLEDKFGIVRFDESLIGYPSNTSHDGQAWAHNLASGEWQWTPLLTLSGQASQFPPDVPVTYCTGVRINEIAANVADESQFIELYNDSDQAVSLQGCRLQTNRSTAAVVFSEETLDPHEYKTVYITDTPLTLTKTTTGTVYLLSSDGNTETDSASYADLAADTSWMYSLSEIWQPTYQRTPGSENVYVQYPACTDGYSRSTDSGQCVKVSTLTNATSQVECAPGKYRNTDTGRCRNLETVAASTQPACDDGQYRSTDTGRCRSLTSSSSLLTPCASNQIRSPDTNRCRSATTAAETGQKPCPKNQERNPTTNRCRTIPSSTVADFPVETVRETSKASVGWWAFGGAGTLAAGYAGWEWRRELAHFIKRMATFAIGRP